MKFEFNTRQHHVGDYEIHKTKNVNYNSNDFSHYIMAAFM